MKKIIGLLSLGILVLGITPHRALADGVSITVNSSYTAGTPTTPFSAPGDAFSFSFSEPSTCTCGPFDSGFSLDTLVNFTFGSTSFTSLPAVVDFAPSSLGGLFDVEITEGGVLYDWFLTGAQLYTVSMAGTTATLTPGIFDILPGDPTNGSGSFFFTVDEEGNSQSAALPGGSVSIPEPSALSLLIFGCLALALATFKRKPLPS